LPVVIGVARLGNSTYHDPMAATENAANLLRSLRREQGRSLRSAAADIGVAPSQLSRLERGQRGLGADVSERIAHYYGVPAEVVALSSGDVPDDVVRILQTHPELIERLRAEYAERAAP
jgi:transcriptional regulator with XRE-family HTH domain